MTEPSNRASQRAEYDRPASSTGSEGSFVKPEVPFFGVQDWYLAVVLNQPLGYGWDPAQNAHLVRIAYRVPDENGVRSNVGTTVAAFLSVKNVDISANVGKDAYRLAVDLADVQDSLSARSDLARALGKKENGAAAERLRETVETLEKRIDTLTEMIQAGWSHIVLATAWTESSGGGFIDRLDLNLDFFNVFYPGECFPIGRPGTVGSGVGRDGFVWKAFPGGRAVPSRDPNGRIAWNRYEWEFSQAGAFEQLRITFNHAPIDAWGQEQDQKSKLLYRKRFPTLEEVAEDIKKNLKAHPRRAAANRARREAFSWVARQQRRQMKEEKRGHKRDVDRLTRLITSVLQAVTDSYDQETLDDIKDIRKTDPMAKDLIRKIRDALSRAAAGQRAGGDKNFYRLIEEVVGKLEERQAGLVKTVRATHFDDPRFLPAVRDALQNLVRVMAFGGRDDKETVAEIADKFAKKLDELSRRDDWRAEDILRILSQAAIYGAETDPAWPERVKGHVQEEATTVLELREALAARTWVAADVARLLSRAGELGAKLAKDLLRRIAIRNTAEILARCRSNPALDDELKVLIEIQVVLLNTGLPPDAVVSPAARAYGRELKGRRKMIQPSGHAVGVKNPDEVHSPKAKL